MAQSTYAIDRFVTDVKQVFANVQDARAQAVAKHMKDLLAVSDLTEEQRVQSVPMKALESDSFK